MILYIIVLLLVLYLLICNKIIIKENIEAFKNMILDNGKIYVINLERRKDRREYFEDIYYKLKINKILDKPIYYKAVDGYNTNIPTWWYKESPYKDVSKEGTWGCFKSHYNLVNEFIKSEDKILLIFEDDAKFIDNFNEEFVNFINNIPSDWEVLYLGFTNNKPPEEVNKYCDRTVSVNTTVSYVLNKKGGKKYLNIFNKKLEDKDNHPFDCTLSAHQKNMKIYQPKKVLINQNTNLKSDVYN